MSVFKYWRSCLAAVLLLFSAAASGALPPPEKLRAQLAAATPEKYPDADTVTICDVERVTYRPDGLSETTNESCVKVLTEAGRKDMREITLNYNAKYGSYSITRAEVVKPDGRVIAVDLKKNVSVAISTRSMGSNIYSEKDKVLTLTVPQLEIGDAVVLAIRYKTFKTPFPGIFSDGFALQGKDPVVFAEVIVDAPEALPLRSIAVKSPVGRTVKFHGEKRGKGRIVYRWTAENVPQLIPEPDMPPFSAVAQKLLVSTAKDWKEISRWYYALCRPRLDAVDDELKAATAKIVSGHKTDREKAMALFQFVSQKIRYTGVDGEDKAPGFEPHDVRDTFRQRHGVCRDKAGLLVAMLELAGLKAYPVLIHVSKAPVDDEVPASRFNHAVVAWETSPGKYQLMDPTCESTTDFFPAYLANKSYLVARPDGDVLRRSPSPPAEDNALDIETVAEFGLDGTLKGESTFGFTGYNDLIYRAALSRRGKDHVRQIFARELQRAIPGVKIEKFAVFPENVRDMSKPLKIVVAYSAPDLLTISGKATALPMPELISRNLGLVSYMVDDISLGARKFPLLFENTSVTREKLTVKLPDPVKLQGLPAAVKLKAPGAEWSRKFTAGKNVVRCESAVKIDRLEVSPKEYGRLRQLRRAQMADLTAAPLVRADYAAIPAAQLTRSFPDADSFLESDRIAIEAKADDSYRIVQTRRRRILTYGGVKKHSEIKIGYDPGYQKVEIGAVVTAPDGKKQTLNPKHVINMDAGWVASAPRYPKACIKVAVLPSVQVGAVVETRIVITSGANGFFSRALPLANDTPTARREVEFRAPAAAKFRVSPPDAGVEFETRREGGASVSIWRRSDVPAIPKEFGQPSSRTFVPTVYISDGRYSVYAKELDRVLRALAKTPSPAADRLFAELKLEKDSPEAKALKIRDAAARKLRSAGPGLDRMRLSELTPPERTLVDGYGNSADRAVAIAALLDRAGIAYTFVAASDLLYLRENVRPLRDYPRQIFDEVLVYIPKLNLYLNDTDQYAVPGSTGHAARIGMDLKSGRINAIRPRLRAEDEDRCTFDIRLAADGSATVKLVREYRGSSFNARKRAYSEMTPEERRQRNEIIAASLLPTGRLEKAVADFSKYPGRIEFDFRVDGFARKVGNKLVFELPVFADAVSAIGATESERKTPMQRTAGSRTILKYRIELPAGYRLERDRPARTELGRRGSGFFTERASLTHDKLSIDARLVLPPELIQPCDYVELVNLQRELGRPARRRIVLTQENQQR